MNFLASLPGGGADSGVNENGYQKL